MKEKAGIHFDRYVYTSVIAPTLLTIFGIALIVYLSRAIKYQI